IRHSVFDYWRQRKEFRDAACSMIEKVGLGHRLKHRPSELSGGEMQRAAIARSLVGQPEVLLADEPTGNLDVQTGREIIALLSKLNADEKLTIIMVTHDDAIARRAQRIVRLREGRLQSLEEAA
ncbi:MAG TPA: ATP-binding cassette domain-containing protein, partial [Caulifigura sp.]|nr:ATP-binding cassette domain-containing protein [Caulifigura sp.]